MERDPVSSLQFPPGFRFHPSDEELITHYLLNKVKSCPLPAHVIADIELYNYNPWELPKKALFGEDEWYFFSPRDRKYPNGERPNRTAASGYWKATGTDKPILTSRSKKKIGVKKSLVFYTGRPPKVVKTDWIMNEYRLPDNTRPSKLKGSMRLDDWVLCRIRQKGNMSKNSWEAARDSAGKERSEYFPNAEELPFGCISPDINIITYFGHEGSRVSAPILVDQPLPHNDNISSEIFQDSNDGNNDGSLHEVGSEKLNSPLAGTFMDIIFNETKRKYDGGSQGTMYDNLLPTTNNNDNENLPQGKQLDSNDGNFYIQNQSERDIFNPNPLNAINSLEGLNESIFTGRFLQ